MSSIEDLDALWNASRSGSHAGRGFHYQDAVTTELALRAWRGDFDLRRLVPEGLDDISLELTGGWLHLQAKSRRGRRGPFSLSALSEAWPHLAERLAADPGARAVLVVEQPIDGLTESGWMRDLADLTSPEVKRAIAGALADIAISAEEFLARTHLVVMPALPATSVDLLADRLGIPAQTCQAHYSILRTKLAQFADENGERSRATAASVTGGDLIRLLDDVSEAVDQSALEQAIRDGICEAVDFATPLSDERFYEGVDVVVGHVVAELPVERPELVVDLTRGLLERGVAIAVGPSGAGKSAAMWMTADATRHLVRWYRVRQLADDDVTAVIRLAKGVRATAEAPVGFVADDLGRDDRAGWDRLVREAAELPGVWLLGACREEDLVLIRTARRAMRVRPRLDARLAERVWRELLARGATRWPDWREPFARSEGLLLEYGHLLTAGERLAETVEEQVERRIVDSREFELDVLALVATADSFGTTVTVTALRNQLSVGDNVLKQALTRLVDEHLIRERDGELGGLHELRSRHVMAAVHRVPPPTLMETMARLVGLLEPRPLQVFLTRVLAERLVDTAALLPPVAAHIQTNQDAEALAAALQALRLVSFQRLAQQWARILAEEGVPPGHIQLVGHFGISDGEIDMFPEPVQRAVARIRALGWNDSRRDLLGLISGDIVATLTAARTVATVTTMLATLAECAQQESIPADAVVPLAEGASLEKLRSLLEAARAASSGLAVALVERLGGPTHLLARLEHERPWLRGVRLGADDEGRLTAEAEYAYVAPSVQPNPHGAVVDLCRMLLALAPGAEVAVCRAVDATGQAAGFGAPLADKRIARASLPSPVAVAWNRARIRAATAAVAAASTTERLVAERELLAATTSITRRIGEHWLARRPPASLAAAADELAATARRLPPAPIAADTSGPLEEGALVMDDAAGFLATMVANNLLPGLFGDDGLRVAPMLPQLVEQADKLAEPQHWSLLSDAPLDGITELRQALVDLHAVLAESAARGKPAELALRTAAKRARQAPLAAAARAARERAEARMRTLAVRLEARLEKRGWHAHVVRRSGPSDASRWPSDDFLIVVEVGTIFVWQRQIEQLAELCRPLLSDRISFLMVPARQGRAVSSCGVEVIIDIFPTDKVNQWSELLPLPLLDEQAGDNLRRGLDGVQEASAILASVRGSEVHDDEVEVLKAAVARAHAAVDYFDRLAAETDDPLIREVEGILLELLGAVEGEAEALANGSPVARSVAASLIRGLQGDGDEAFVAQVLAAAACVEWDAEPTGACQRVEQALAAWG
jgi:hypothetical protein